MHTIQRMNIGSIRRAPGRERAEWPLDGDLHLTAHGASETGPVRPRNEDAFLIANVVGGHPEDTAAIPLLAVADGVGGNAGGEEASGLAIRAGAREARRLARRGAWSPGRPIPDVEASLGAVVEASHEAIVRRGAMDPALARMATTLTLGLVRGRLLHLAHVGDSRCYLARGHQCAPLTTDHTLAHMLESEGLPPATRPGAWLHVLVNALAANKELLAVDTRTIALRADDVLLLCSDGVSNAVEADGMLAVFQSATSASAAAGELVERALGADGSDNVTAVVARVEARGF